ncbi:hypothetical protein ASF71_19560 [Deinococcus sp. Leaf326]|jgi:hypothetical protein|nr:hypothetical protein ASF71_19560 [Deinococcus sp. Leaf326]
MMSRDQDSDAALQIERVEGMDVWMFDISETDRELPSPLFEDDLLTTAWDPPQLDVREWGNICADGNGLP